MTRRSLASVDRRWLHRSRSFKVTDCGTNRTNTNKYPISHRFQVIADY